MGLSRATLYLLPVYILFNAVYVIIPVRSGYFYGHIVTKSDLALRLIGPTLIYANALKACILLMEQPPPIYEL